MKVNPGPVGRRFALFGPKMFSFSTDRIDLCILSTTHRVEVASKTLQFCACESYDKRAADVTQVFTFYTAEISQLWGQRAPRQLFSDNRRLKANPGAVGRRFAFLSENISLFTDRIDLFTLPVTHWVDPPPKTLQFYALRTALDA